MKGSGDSWLSLKTSLNALRRAVRLYARNHSSHAFLQAISFLVRKGSGQFPPINAVIAITYCCQCQCPHCYSSIQDRSISQELSTAEIIGVLDQLKEMGTLQVLFTGGEPLLRKDIFDLVAHAHGIGLLTRISTNGYLLDRACAAKLKSAGLDQCGVSIDQVDADGHDRFRALPGSHARALQAFGYLRQFRIHRFCESVQGAESEFMLFPHPLHRRPLG
jgi:MoaA/NifB/PqqE/SkfB family radical SAM enzyme